MAFAFCICKICIFLLASPLQRDFKAIISNMITYKGSRNQNMRRGSKRSTSAKACKLEHACLCTEVHSILRGYLDVPRCKRMDVQFPYFSMPFLQT